MTDFQTISDNLVNNLQLQYKPVGVKVYTESDPYPENISFTEKELKSYCQAVIMAGEGETLLLEKEKMGCKLGTSVLGFEKEMEAYLDDGVLEKYGVGLFETEEASAETILKSTYLEKGKSRVALIAPLPAFDQTPQVVIFTANSEQIMWLLYALNYEKGEDGTAAIRRCIGWLRGHHRPAPADRETQHHLFRFRVPYEISHWPL